MSRYFVFTFRVNQEEREMISAMAKQLQRTQSDAIRLIIREAADSLLNRLDVADNDSQILTEMTHENKR